MACVVCGKMGQGDVESVTATMASVLCTSLGLDSSRINGMCMKLQKTKICIRCKKKVLKLGSFANEIQKFELLAAAYSQFFLTRLETNTHETESKRRKLCKSSLSLQFRHELTQGLRNSFRKALFAATSEFKKENYFKPSPEPVASIPAVAYTTPVGTVEEPVKALGVDRYFVGSSTVNFTRCVPSLSFSFPAQRRLVEYPKNFTPVTNHHGNKETSKLGLTITSDDSKTATLEAFSISDNASAKEATNLKNISEINVKQMIKQEPQDLICNDGTTSAELCDTENGENMDWCPPFDIEVVPEESPNADSDNDSICADDEDSNDVDEEFGIEISDTAPFEIVNVLSPNINVDDSPDGYSESPEDKGDAEDT